MHRFLSIFVVALSFGTSGLDAEEQAGAQPKEVKLSAAQAELIGLETAYAKKTTLAREIWLNGEVTADQDRTLQVLPRAGGVVVEVKKALGDEVRTNDVLAFIESQEISSSSAAYLVAKSKASLAQRQLERHETLWKKNVIAEEEYLISQQGAAEAQAQLRAAAQKLALLGIDAATVDNSAPPSVSTRVPVLAPMSGTIIEKKIAVGDQVTDQTPLFRLADLEKVWVIASAFEQDMGQLAVGLPATVVLRAYPDRKFQGRVTWVSQVVDERTRTLAIRVELDNSDKLLRPGSFARVLIKVPMREASVSIPPNAVQRHNQEQIVFVDAGGGVYKLRSVKTNLKTPNEVEIVSGLAAGEKVVTDGSFMLKSELEKSSFGGE
ncbi:efflux RND transporter periplasmic adaptor subunit [Hyphomicrobium sp.]|uniref:efflux RND transporter periplasmic adaptor subunit n=1 Tax=Hyphomicrobium sp. TaxID=82 RepID=UPI001DC9F982|nr:efflux RND transporter periplasmic adaptor subunit [Hyphomicrobium sp.]MBY0558512.1 efflux RND transporter periplasmic adaptor subunit [Hyphomicrobium sp.]